MSFLTMIQPMVDGRKSSIHCAGHPQLDAHAIRGSRAGPAAFAPWTHDNDTTSPTTLQDPAQRRLEACLAQAGVPPRFVIETPYSATQCALVLAGAGLAVTNPLVAREYAMLGLRSVPLAFDVAFRAMLAFNPRQTQSRAGQEFVGIC